MHRFFLQSHAVLVVANDARLGIVVRAPDPDARASAAGLDLAAFRRPHAPTPPGTTLLVGLDVETARALVRAHGGAKSPANADAVALLARLPPRVDPDDLPTEAAPPPPLQDRAPGRYVDGTVEDDPPPLLDGPVAAVPDDDEPGVGAASAQDHAPLAAPVIAPPLRRRGPPPPVWPVSPNAGRRRPGYPTSPRDRDTAERFLRDIAGERMRGSDGYGRAQGWANATGVDIQNMDHAEIELRRLLALPHAPDHRPAWQR